MASQQDKKVKGLRVITKKDGFRRGGREWHGTTEVPVTEFDKKQLAQLKAEDGRMLVVQECQIIVPAGEVKPAE